MELTMIRIMLLILICVSLSSCETVQNIQNDEKLSNIGNFQLNPVHPNSFWYNGTSYEYNEYEIEITSSPCKAMIKWDKTPIGTTPLIYHYSGILDKGDRIVIKAIPVDETLPAQDAVLKIRTELPRKINFDLNKK